VRHDSRAALFISTDKTNKQTNKRGKRVAKKESSKDTKN
jgi:hypothetical protein